MDQVIESHLQDWTLDRRRRSTGRSSVSRVGVFHATDVPPVVAVDEAVELAKELSPTIRRAS
ncbi:hypothetical protein GS938_17945 [Rhodococcus hoagii]|nr:hypothetical protein [Prescottella equi]